MPDYILLAVNPGSTSTKIAIYEDMCEVFVKNIGHSTEELSRYKSIADQYEMRKSAILSSLRNNGFNINCLSAVVGRGGMLPPLRSGAYVVNERMINRLKNRPVAEHASNLGALIAFEIASTAGIPAFIYDAVSVDELEPVAKISGLPEIGRRSFVHTLNMRAVAAKVAAKIGRSYNDSSFIVAHLGGGISISAHRSGKMIDIVSDDEGPFSPERAGRVPCTQLVELCYSGKYGQKEMFQKFRGRGGLTAYLMTADAQEVEDKIRKGDKDAELVYYAMAYQIAKGIGEMAAVLNGKVDRIIITGGIAHSRMITEWIEEKIRFIAPIITVPGENELESLAFGALRVLKNEEESLEYDLE